MYSQYISEYKDLASVQYSKSGQNRKAIFEETVRDIISHNSNPSHSWKKGINQYSDMTEEEFFDYFHISTEQNCSATKRPPAKLANA